MVVMLCLQSTGPHTYSPVIWPGDTAARNSGSCFSPLGEFEQIASETERDMVRRISQERGWPTEPCSNGNSG